MTKQSQPSTASLWARFRFSVVGSLLSSPPARGSLQRDIRSLASRTWAHPVSGREVHFAAATIERWYYKARRAKDDPVGVLRRAVRKDCGKVSLAADFAERLSRQYHEHKHWSYQLHYDNLAALVKADSSLGPLRSYSTVRRYMKTHGLMRLGIIHEKTLPYSPHQNGKQEIFWATLEGRLMQMLEGVAELTLHFLNDATQAWVEIEYNRTEQRDTRSSPIERFCKSPNVLRSSPASNALRDAFRLETKRRQRQSDGTISLDGVRFEIPARYRHFADVVVRYARWDMGRVHIVDARNAAILAAIYPLDRTGNADGRRSVVEPDNNPSLPAAAEGNHRAANELPPLLKRILAEYSASGMPPAYLPKRDPRKGEAS